MQTMAALKDNSYQLSSGPSEWELQEALESAF